MSIFQNKITFACYLLFNFFVQQNKFGLIWSSILKRMEFLIMDFLFNLSYNLKMHYFRDDYAF